MINTATNTSVDLREIRIAKTVRRKFAEAGLYFWGVCGGIACLYMAHQAFRLDMLARTEQISVGSGIPAVIMYTFIWIGGLVFLGFFALLAPQKVGLLANQPRRSAGVDAFEQSIRPNDRPTVRLVQDDKISKVATR